MVNLNFFASSQPAMYNIQYIHGSWSLYSIMDMACNGVYYRHTYVHKLSFKIMAKCIIALLKIAMDRYFL